MWTKSGHAGSLLRRGLARSWTLRDRFSWKPRNAPLGALVFVAILSSVTMIPAAVSFAAIGTSPNRVLAMVFLLFPPAILAAVYSLFFEKSKLYGSLDLLLAGIVLLVQPFTWGWLNLSLPFACAFTVFCAVVWSLAHGTKR
ncbi:MAG: hypothetical protein WBX03_10410 [Terriglobales bacterium]|jgi:hypothetical protein